MDGHDDPEIDPEEDSNSEDEEDDSAEIEEGIRKIKYKLLDNPFDYNTHLELISFTKNHGELDSLRAARQDMSEKFPLTPSLWLEWIEDEKALLTDDEGRNLISQLFDRAVKDYSSVDLWLEYAQFAMTDMGSPEGIENVRRVVNRGLAQVGLDASKASLLWDFLREIETIVLNLISNQEDKKNQVNKILDVYRRQLSVPLMNMHTTMAEFESFCQDNESILNSADIAQIKGTYEKTLKFLEQIMPFEDALLSCSPETKSEHFKSYISFLEKHSTPASVQCVYERSSTDNPLDPDVWIRYGMYMDKTVKIKELSREVYDRSVRNSPWSGTLWSRFIESLEQFEYPLSEIIQVFERSLQAGLASGADFKQVWTSYLDCQRRRTNFDSQDEVERLRKNFNSASEYLAAMPDADPSFSILQYYARVEAVFCKNMVNCREIWNNMMQMKELSCQSSLWLEFYHLEYAFGDRKEARKILMRALTPSLDWPEVIGELVLRMEREEGDSLEVYQKALNKYNQIMIKVSEKRTKNTENPSSSTSTSKKPLNKGKIKGDQQPPKDSRKRKADQSMGDAVAFKKPLLPPEKKEPKKKGTDEQPHYLKPKEKTEADDLLTVFVSNLDFKVDEEKLNSIFSDFGTITDIRLVRNYKGLSKGFAYIQFSSMEGVHKALSNDRLNIDGRPTFISEVGKKKEFQFKDSEEKNKLFVNGLANHVNEQTLRDVFEKYGQLRGIRIVTYRNGHSKGCAYIEYVDELGAQAGLAADGLLLEGKNIKVAISDPKRKNVQPSNVLGSAASGPGTSRGVTSRPRISVPMVPSVLRRQVSTDVKKPNGTH